MSSRASGPPLRGPGPIDQEDERLELTRGVSADYAPPVMRLADKVAIVDGGSVFSTL